jgi:hypothetical protein
MKVTQLIQNIGKCRDVLATKDFKEVLKHIHLFQKVYEMAKREVDRFISSDTYEIDFTYHDLKELSDEIYAFVKNYQNKFVFDYGYKKLSKIHKITNDVVREHSQEQCDFMYVDKKLREAYKIIAYLAITTWLWTESREQAELDWQVTQAIRSFL